MARLGKAELEQIANERGLRFVDINDYVNMDNEMKFKCEKCGNIISSSVRAVRGDRFICSGCHGQKTETSKTLPKKDGVRVVSFDQATYNFGFSVFDRGKLVYYGTEVFNKNLSLETRLVKIGEFIDLVCRYWDADYIIFEDIQLQGNTLSGYNTFKTLAQLYGVVKYCVNKSGIKNDSVSNKVWQAEFSISGKDRLSQKINCIKKVKELFRVDVTDDEADAILLGYYAVRKLNSKPIVRGF